MCGTCLQRVFCVISLAVCVSVSPIVRLTCILCEGSIVYWNASPCSGRTEAILWYNGFRRCIASLRVFMSILRSATECRCPFFRQGRQLARYINNPAKRRTRYRVLQECALRFILSGHDFSTRYFAAGDAVVGTSTLLYRIGVFSAPL